MSSSAEDARFWELSTELLCAVGFDGYLKRVNPAWQRMLAWSSAEVCSRPWIELVHPDDRERTEAEAARLIGGGHETVNFENRCRRKDGEYRTLLWSARTLPEEGLIYATGRDVTESNRAHDALRSSERFLESVLEHIPHMVFIKDAAELRFVRFNAAGEELIGLPRSELIGKNDYDFFPRAQADFFTAKDREVLAEGELVDIPEEPIDTRHHGKRYLHTRKIPLLDESRRPRYLLGISEDITERKEAEAELAIRLEAEQRARAQAERAKAEAERAQAEAERAQAEAERAQAEAEAARQRISQLLALSDVALSHHRLDDLLDDLLARLREYLRADTGAILLVDDAGGTLVARAANGLEEEVERGVRIPLGEGFAGRVADERRPVVIDPLKGDGANGLWREKGVRSLLGVPLLVDGAAIGVLHVGTLTPRDFDEQDVQLLQLVADRAALAIERARLFEAEQAAHAAAEAAMVEADQANRAKSEFLSRVSHELRTPLNAIIGFGQVLDQELVEDRHREDMQHILRAGRHLLELINEVLEISRIETGELALSPEPVPVAGTVREVVALVAPLAAEREVRLDADMEGLSDDAHVWADRQRLRQVLLNLLSNAIKYNRSGGRVQISFAGEDPGRIRTLIADTGVGIDPARLAQLFEPFERLGAEHSGVEGTGLGLALSKRLVEAMGGSIAVESKPGEGTTFAIELAAADRPGRERITDATPLIPPGLAHRLGTGRQVILYIEDNLSNLTLIERILDQHVGLELVPAMQGRMGLELARQHTPDLVVLDLHLPDLGGEEVMRRLKADEATREIPVVVLSADASKSQIVRLMRLGASDYLTKPLDVTRFLNTIAAHLSIERAR